jgi:hypothetical protein
LLMVEVDGGFIAANEICSVRESPGHGGSEIVTRDGRVSQSLDPPYIIADQLLRLVPAHHGYELLTYVAGSNPSYTRSPIIAWRFRNGVPEPVTPNGEEISGSLHGILTPYGNVLQGILGNFDSLDKWMAFCAVRSKEDAARYPG